MLQTVNKQILEYHPFVSAITGMVKKKLGDDYHIQIYKVTKNNSLELDSMLVQKKGKNCAPNIYLMPFYDSYLEGTALEKIAERICRIYYESVGQIKEEDFNYSFASMKQSIIYRLVSYERNRELLKQIPHIKHLDLAITFYSLVRNGEEDIGTLRITNDHLRVWNISLDELNNYAAKNTRALLPASIHSMEELIRGMLDKCTDSFTNDRSYENLLNQSVISEPVLPDNKIYILTNKKGINGAACMLYENLLSEFASRIRSDFYILPSSIHEIIIVPAVQNMSRKALTQMVMDVNRTQVAQDEILSDRVYYYSRVDNEILM
jgi:hypothetical protein